MPHPARILRIKVPRPGLAVGRSCQTQPGQRAILATIRVIHEPLPGPRGRVPLAPDRRLRGHGFAKRFRRLRGQHRLQADAADRSRRNPGIPVRPSRADRQPDPVLHRGLRAGIINVIGVLFLDVEHRVEAEAAGIPSVLARREHRVALVLMPREGIRFQRPRLAEITQPPVRRRHARVKHHEPRRIFRIRNDARLLDLLRLPRCSLPVDNDLPPNRRWARYLRRGPDLRSRQDE